MTRPGETAAAEASTYESERRLRQFRDRLRDGKVRALRHGVRGEPQPGVLKLLNDQTTLVWLPRPSRWGRLIAWPSNLCALVWSWTCKLMWAHSGCCWWFACRCFSVVSYRLRGRRLGFDGDFSMYQPGSSQEVDEAWREITIVAITDVRSVRDGRQTTNFLRTLKYIDPELLPESDDRCLSLCALPMDVLALSSPSSSPSTAGRTSSVTSGGKSEQGGEVVEDVSLADTERLVIGGSSSSSMSSLSMNAMATSTTAIWTLDLEFEDADTRNVARSFFVRSAHLAGTIDLCEPQDVPLPHGVSIVCFQVLSHPSFELLVLAVVSAAMLHIALKPFVEEEDEEDGVHVSDVMSPLEWALLALLTGEQVAKVVSLEGIGPVLHKPWDTFDFVVVVLSWLALAASALTSTSSWAIARALAGVDMLPLRVFRCLRVLKSWRGFREVLDTFLASLPMAGNALLCYCYYLFLFSILGMYLFNDSLSHRCAINLGSPAGGASEWVAAFPNRFCKLSTATSFINSMTMVDSTACGGSTSLHACVTMSAPNNGNTGFHSFQASFLTVYLITLRAGFGSALDGALQASSYLSIAYFIALVVFVSYTILALFVGIVRGAYIAVSILGGARQREREAQLTAYLAKRRPRIPSATNKFPDVAQLVLRWWRAWCERVRDGVLRSPLFQSRDDPEDSFLASFRLRQHCVFFILEPGGAALDRIATVCDSLLFEHFMNAVVFINAVLFSLEYHGMSAGYAARLHTIETALIVVYAVEFVLVCANSGGLLSYLRSPWNRLDFLILLAVAAEYVSMAVSLVLYTDTTTRVVFAFRLFRLVRPFRAVRNKNELMQVLDALMASVPALLSVTAFFLVLTSVFAVLGMRLFGGKFPASMRSNYDTFGDAMLTLFKVSCGGNLWQIFHASLEAAQASVVVTMGFYLGYFVLAVHLSLNILVVVLLRNFAMNEDERKKTLSGQFQERMLVMQRVHHFDEYTFVRAFSDLYLNDTMYLSLAGSAEKRAKITRSVSEELKLRLLRVLPMSEFLRFSRHSKAVAAASNAAMNDHRGGTSGDSGAGNGRYKQLAERDEDRENDDDNIANADEEPPLSVVVDRPGSPNARGNRREDVDIDPATWSLFPWLNSPLRRSSPTHRKHSVRSYVRCFVDGQWLTADVSLFLFPPNSPFRLRCRQLEKETDKYIFAVIVIRTVMLTVQSPLYSALIQEITVLSDLVYACTLLFEFTIKVVSRGFMLTPNSYLSNPWNQMNMVVLLACSLLLLLPHSPMRMLFRLARAFGPVRVFYRVKTFRVITEALKQSAKQLLCCVLLAAFMFYAFATLGMQLFAGKFSFCNDPSVHARVECAGFFASDKAGVLMPRVWGNLAGMHFDNIGGAMGSVLVLVSKKGWLPVLNLAMDIVDGDHQPVQNASAYFAIFFVAFIFFSRFYVLKVFAGIIMNNFRCYNGTLLLSNLQLMWMRNKQAVLALRPKYPVPSNALLERVQRFAQARRFRAFIGSAVMLHTFLLAWFRSPVGRNEPNGVWWCHYTFSVVYALDAVVNIASMGWKDFFMKGFTWRTFNSVTAFVMLVGPAVSDSPVLLILFMTRAFDFKYISLVFERFAALSTLFETLHASARLTLKVSLLLGYALFVFAIIGVQIFPITRWGYGLDANTNFATFPNAFSSFVKFAAGEDWFDTYQASSVAAPRCVSAMQAESVTATTTTSNNAAGNNSDCGSSLLSAIFYNVFYVLVALVLQNLYAATIVDTYVSTSAVIEARGQSERLLGFTGDHLRRFQQVWSEFDTGALGYVHIKHLLPLLTQLELPLGLGTHAEMLAQCVTEDMSRERVAEMATAVHQHRRESFHDVEARVAELAFRSLVAGGSATGAEDVLPGLGVIGMGIGVIAGAGTTATGGRGSGAEHVVLPGRMLRFSDLLLVLTSRVVPLDSLTVQEKVDELAVRGYSFRHRQAVRIQAAFRMYRVRRRQWRVKRQSNAVMDTTIKQRGTPTTPTMREVQAVNTESYSATRTSITKTDEWIIATEATDAVENGTATASRTVESDTMKATRTGSGVGSSSFVVVTPGAGGSNTVEPPSTETRSAIIMTDDELSIEPSQELPPVPRTATTSAERLMMLFEGRI